MRALGLASVGLLLAGGAFYGFQHSSLGIGGAIAPVKALWLFDVILFWFVLPLFWALDRELDSGSRRACAALLTSMTARAVVELTMMYGTENWCHAYGIAHDVFSVLLCALLVFALRHKSRWLPGFFAFCAVLFCFEIGFASYLRSVSEADGTVFFLPSEDAHRHVLALTWLALGISAAALIVTLRGWIRATPAH